MMPKKLTPYKVADTWGRLHLVLGNAAKAAYQQNLASTDIAMGKAQELLDTLKSHDTALVIEKGKAKMKAKAKPKSKRKS